MDMVLARLRQSPDSTGATALDPAALATATCLSKNHDFDNNAYAIVGERARTSAHLNCRRSGQPVRLSWNTPEHDVNSNGMMSGSGATAAPSRWSTWLWPATYIRLNNGSCPVSGDASVG
jgi:hypothetical protein